MSPGQHQQNNNNPQIKLSPNSQQKRRLSIHNKEGLSFFARQQVADGSDSDGSSPSINLLKQDHHDTMNPLGIKLHHGH